MALNKNYSFLLLLRRHAHAHKTGLWSSVIMWIMQISWNNLDFSLSLSLSLSAPLIFPFMFNKSITKIVLRHVQTLLTHLLTNVVIKCRRRKDEYNTTLLDHLSIMIRKIFFDNPNEISKYYKRYNTIYQYYKSGIWNYEDIKGHFIYTNMPIPNISHYILNVSHGCHKCNLIHTI